MQYLGRNPETTIVLLHDCADGASSWDQVAEGLAEAGHAVLRPDLLGYGASPQPSCCYKIAKEVLHLKRCLDAQRTGVIHLAGHGYGAYVGLHLRHALGPRVKSMTLVSPFAPGILREFGDIEAQSELDQAYRRFMSLSTHNESAARFFIDYWRGQGAWQAMSAAARAQSASIIPKVRREMVALHADRARLAALAGPSLPAAVLIGEQCRRPVRASGWRLAEAFDTDPIPVDGAGHMIPSTHPDAVIDAILRLAAIEIRRRVSRSSRASAAMPQAAFA